MNEILPVVNPEMTRIGFKTGKIAEQSKSQKNIIIFVKENALRSKILVFY